MASRAEMLTRLHNSVPHNGQIEAWQADLKAFEELKADFEENLRRVRGEAYQVATWFTAFQAGVFTAISQPSLLTCRLWWCPVSLSVSVYVAAFLAIADKLYSMGNLKEDINETNLAIAAIMEKLNSVPEVEGADLNLETAQPRQEIPRKKLAGYRFIASKEGMSALLFLTSLSTIVACFSAKTLCLHCLSCLR